MARDFNVPGFDVSLQCSRVQRQLHDFARQFEKGSAGFRKALLPLVRRETTNVFPIKFGDLLVLSREWMGMGEGMIVTSGCG